VPANGSSTVGAGRREPGERATGPVPAALTVGCVVSVVQGRGPLAPGGLGLVAKDRGKKPGKAPPEVRAPGGRCTLACPANSARKGVRGACPIEAPRRGSAPDVSTPLCQSHFGPLPPSESQHVSAAGGPCVRGWFYPLLKSAPQVAKCQHQVLPGGSIDNSRSVSRCSREWFLPVRGGCSFSRTVCRPSRR